MRLFGLVSLYLIVSLPGTVWAQPSKCSAPPYGGKVASYKAFIKDFGPILSDPVKMLSGICAVKFEGADRKALYGLGFTDQDINSKDTADLAAEMLMALKGVVGGR